jgi:hypothetical protein
VWTREREERRSLELVRGNPLVHPPFGLEPEMDRIIGGEIDPREQMRVDEVINTFESLSMQEMLGELVENMKTNILHSKPNECGGSGGGNNNNGKKLSMSSSKSYITPSLQSFSDILAGLGRNKRKRLSSARLIGTSSSIHDRTSQNLHEPSSVNNIPSSSLAKSASSDISTKQLPSPTRNVSPPARLNTNPSSSSSFSSIGKSHSPEPMRREDLHGQPKMYRYGYWDEPDSDAPWWLPTRTSILREAFNKNVWKVFFFFFFFFVLFFC